MKKKLPSRLYALLILLLLCLSGNAFAAGGIKGTVTDQSGTPLINVVINVMQSGKTISSGLTDFDGNYIIQPLAAGIYDVEFKYLNVVDNVTHVVVNDKQLVVADKRLNGIPLSTKEVIVRKYFKKPQLNAPARGMRRTGELEKAAAAPEADMVAQYSPCLPAEEWSCA